MIVKQMLLAASIFLFSAAAVAAPNCTRGNGKVVPVISWNIKSLIDAKRALLTIELENKTGTDFRYIRGFLTFAGPFRDQQVTYDVDIIKDVETDETFSHEINVYRGGNTKRLVDLKPRDFVVNMCVRGLVQQDDVVVHYRDAKDCPPDAEKDKLRLELQNRSSGQVRQRTRFAISDRCQ